MTIRPIDRMTDDELFAWIRDTCIDTGIADPDPLIIIGIAQTLRAVTGEAGMRIHHGRHSLASHLECMMTLQSLPPEKHARKVF